MNMDTIQNKTVAGTTAIKNNTYDNSIVRCIPQFIKSKVKEKLTVPALPDLARSILKKSIVSMANVGLITGASAEQLISLLQLRDA